MKKIFFLGFTFFMFVTSCHLQSLFPTKLPLNIRAPSSLFEQENFYDEAESALAIQVCQQLRTSRFLILHSNSKKDDIFFKSEKMCDGKLVQKDVHFQKIIHDQISPLQNLCERLSLGEDGINRVSFLENNGFQEIRFALDSQHRKQVTITKGKVAQNNQLIINEREDYWPEFNVSEVEKGNYLLKYIYQKQCPNEIEKNSIIEYSRH